jgi:hypothetical protein
LASFYKFDFDIFRFPTLAGAPVRSGLFDKHLGGYGMNGRFSIRLGTVAQSLEDGARLEKRLNSEGTELVDD